MLFLITIYKVFLKSKVSKDKVDPQRIIDSTTDIMVVFAKKQKSALLPTLFFQIVKTVVSL